MALEIANLAPRTADKAAKTGAKRGAKGAAPVDSSEDEDEGEGGEEDDDGAQFNWACCDRCEKWRRLPPGEEYEADNLPEQWFCEMNPGTRNTCDHPEERMGKDEARAARRRNAHAVAAARPRTPSPPHTHAPSPPHTHASSRTLRDG